MLSALDFLNNLLRKGQGKHPFTTSKDVREFKPYTGSQNLDRLRVPHATHNRRFVTGRNSEAFNSRSAVVMGTTRMVWQTERSALSKSESNQSFRRLFLWYSVLAVYQSLYPTKTHHSLRVLVAQAGRYLELIPKNWVISIFSELVDKSADLSTTRPQTDFCWAGGLLWPCGAELKAKRVKPPMPLTGELTTCSWRYGKFPIKEHLRCDMGNIVCVNVN